jgi:hypothetical protein
MKIIILGISVFAITAAIVVAYPLYQKSANAQVVTTPIDVPPTAKTERPLIQMAILLDTSGSMDGLINQTRDQLWQVVNQFAKSTKDGVTPRLEVAVFEYGNDNLSAESGYIRKVADLTTELDGVSEALFSLTTNGGSEYCGYVIQEAVKQLEWSHADDAVKVIFIAGNEPFTQGPVPYQQAIGAAKTKGITVNTIHAGNMKTGAESGWKAGAMLAGGDYMSIDQNHVVAHVNAPQDTRLAELNARLNQTYVPYGAEGTVKAERQTLMDSKNKEVSMGQLAKRVISKASKLYRNDSWDLVDALEDGKVDLATIDEEKLPEPMKKMDKRRQKEYVIEKSQERKELKEEISRLSKQREVYVAQQKAKSPEAAVNTMNEAMTSAIERQSKAKGFSFEEKP